MSTESEANQQEERPENLTEEAQNGENSHGDNLPPPLRPNKRFRRPEKGKPGRPFKIKQETIDRILAYIRAGAYIETAAIASGVSKPTFYVWLKYGNTGREKVERGEQPTKEERLAIGLLDSLEKANSEAEVSALIKINKASNANWQAAAWLLERKNPEKYGRRDYVKQEVTGKDGGPVKSETTVAIAESEKDEIFRRHFEAIEAERKRREAGGSAEGAKDEEES